MNGNEFAGHLAGRILVGIVVVILLGASLAFVGGLWWRTEPQSRPSPLEERLERLEKRDRDVREYLARHARPPQMLTFSTQREAQWFATHQLDPETLKWVEVGAKDWHFGVMKPPQTGATGATGSIGQAEGEDKK